jgi:hypothetical protein
LPKSILDLMCTIPKFLTFGRSKQPIVMESEHKLTVKEENRIKCTDDILKVMFMMFRIKDTGTDIKAYGELDEILEKGLDEKNIKYLKGATIPYFESLGGRYRNIKHTQSLYFIYHILSEKEDTSKWLKIYREDVKRQYDTFSIVKRNMEIMHGLEEGEMMMDDHAYVADLKLRLHYNNMVDTCKLGLVRMMKTKKSNKEITEKIDEVLKEAHKVNDRRDIHLFRQWHSSIIAQVADFAKGTKSSTQLV